MGTRWEGAGVRRGLGFGTHVVLAIGLLALVVLTMWSSGAEEPTPTARDRAEQLTASGRAVILPAQLPVGEWRLLAGGRGATPTIETHHVHLERGKGEEHGGVAICVAASTTPGKIPSHSAAEQGCGERGTNVRDEIVAHLRVRIDVTGDPDVAFWTRVGLTDGWEQVRWLDLVSSPS